MKVISPILILVLIVISCDFSPHEKEIRMYGTAQDKNDSLFVSLRLSDFDNYGKLLERITTIDCNDSVAQIIIEDENVQRVVFPLIECKPPPFCPKSSHYATIVNGKAYHYSSLDLIDFDLLQTIIQKDYALDFKGAVTIYLVIIEANPEENTNGVEDFILHLTREFDAIETNLYLNIALWTTVMSPPPPPNELEDI